MKTYVFIFDGFVQFEIMLATYFLKSRGEIVPFAISKDPVTSYEGFSILPFCSIEQVDVERVDLLVIPGGDVSGVALNKHLHELLQHLHQKKRGIGAICAGTLLLGQAGVLNGHSFTTNSIEEMEKLGRQGTFLNTDVVTDRHIVTAKANAYVDFGIELGKLMDIYENEQDLDETISFFKYFKPLSPNERGGV
ncbi:DJ-1/PfpI family protein [Paenibacillus sp. BJ-4]|uniref:DJ-1/PfpI family protein n=1 Tax=Paenibacillus sp. BJ-4 TaxID=2878097 RepID=UPI001CEFC6DD|nr:DJ-1/PfpI family protein [Paenibacillus sp. BJ-4]